MRRHAGRRFVGKQLVGDPISLRTSAAKVRSVACCAFQPNRPMRTRPVPMSTTRAARPLIPSALRSSGSSSARIVSSAMASTSPAPKTGIGTRRAMMLASGGITGWQPCGGFENRW
jgi:hypothetical protein